MSQSDHQEVGNRHPARKMLFFAGNVLRGVAFPVPVAIHQPEERYLGDDQPEADQHRDQKNQMVDASRKSGSPC